MNRYSRLLFPILSRVDAESAHERTLQALQRAQASPLGRTLLRRIAGELPESKPVELWGLRFPNILGVAAGYDKDARVAQGLAMLGFGHVEVGTITPWPQEGNGKPRVFRLPDERAIINRMGFPNGGMVQATQRLRKLRLEQRDFVLGVSMGKQKQTRLSDAFTDYATVMRSVYPYADYLVINISSPNTPGLRSLQSRRYIAELLGQLTAENRNLGYLNKMERRPLLVKVSPDISLDELDNVLLSSLDLGIDGIIATNTTLDRSELTTNEPYEEGGLSGAPLAARSTQIIRHIAEQSQSRLPIIGVGGIFSPEDVEAKIDAGASLVQLYTGLIYQGPGLAGSILRSLAEPAQIPSEGD